MSDIVYTNLFYSAFLASPCHCIKEIALNLYHRLSTDIENTDLFDKVVDLTYENEQLRSKIQILQDKLEKAYEFMKQFVINGRNMLDVFRERIGEVKEWVHRKVAGMGQ